MGYTTDFEGSFKLNKPLGNDMFVFLTKLAETRRMKRKVSEKYGIEGEFYIDGSGDFGQGDEDNIIDYNYPPSTQPGLWLQWIPTEDRMSIEWDGNEKFYHATEWIIYLIDNILAPMEYVLNGTVYAQGESQDDKWHINIIDNVVTVIYD